MTLVDEHEGVVSDGAAAPPARHRRKKLLYAGAVLLIAVSAGLGWREYSEVQSIANHPAPTIGNSPVSLFGDGVFYDELGKKETFVRLVEDGQYTLTFRISNPGDRTIRVESFPTILSPWFEAPTTKISAVIAPDGNSQNPMPRQPFKPFDLKPGEQRSVLIELRLREGCKVAEKEEPLVALDDDRVSLRSGGSMSTVISSIDVEYTVAGRERSGTLPSDPIHFVTSFGTHPADCPEP